MNEATTESGGHPAAIRSGAGGPLADTRSAVTNGTRLHVEAVGDTAWSRRFRDIVDQLLAQLGDAPTEQQEMLARSAAMLAVDAERDAARMLRGEQVDSAAMVTRANALRRTLNDLGVSGRHRRRRAPLRTSTATAEAVALA